jgi:hypothetical protein
MVFARNASAGTCPETGEVRKKKLAPSSRTEQRKREADMMAPVAEVPTTLKHFC